MTCFSLRIPVLLTLFSCLIFFSNVCAETIPLEKIINKLDTLEAVVIKAPGGRYLLNLGSDHDIRKGGLWRVYTKGEKVLDPVTGKELGVLPVSSVVCRVTRVEKQFSELSVQCPEGSCSIQSGAVAKQYHSIKALFQDVDGKSFHLYERIRAGLPLLDWQGYQRIKRSSNARPPAYGVMLVADRGRLTLWSGGEILAAFDGVTWGDESVQPELDPPLVARPDSAKNGFPQKGAGLPPAVRPPGLSSSLEMVNYQAVFSMDKMVTDFGIIDPCGTKNPYSIYLVNDVLYARSLNGKQLYEYPFQGFGDVVNISIGPKGFIAVNIYVNSGRMESRILKFTGDGFIVTENDIDAVLQFNDIDGNGINESLLGQNFDPENFLDSEIFLLEMDDSGRIQHQDSLDTPRGVNLTGTVRVDFDGNNILETFFYTPGGKLAVYETGEKRWESFSSFAPGKMMLIDDGVNEADTPGELPVWPHPAVFSSHNIVLAAFPANDTDSWSMAGSRSGSGGIGIIYSNQGEYVFRRFNSGFQGRVQSVVIHDNKFYLAVVEGNRFIEKGRTHILSVSMDEFMTSINPVR